MTMLSMAPCWCCGEGVVPRYPDQWEGRMDGYCIDCAHARCDWRIGSCGKANDMNGGTDGE